MLHHKGCYLTVEFTEDGHVTVTHLVQHTDGRSFSEGSIFSSLKRTDIRDIAVIADGIIINIVTNLFNQTVVADSHITECRVIDTRMFMKPLGHLDHLVEGTQADIAIEHHSVEIIRNEILIHQYALPVLCPAYIVL